eukprot:TRINITY_DN37782_c0_g1_i1.p1 TRINITY_DN37782_c0_g1~~TRINITY_DN37782_c0_g1_i1.p1  ORF type:complete len:473 (+),score=74.70 TRINITY_DN37782_c0_g1_i1:68-1486(+)
MEHSVDVLTLSVQSLRKLADEVTSAVLNSQLQEVWRSYSIPAPYALVGLVVCILLTVISRKNNGYKATLELKASRLEGKQQMLDDVIIAFAPFAQRLERGPTQKSRRAALARLRVLVELLETPNLNHSFRAHNWSWLRRWENGMVTAEETRRRCELVFPTVSTAARVQKSENFPTTADLSASLSYLSCWCNDFLERPDVKIFLSSPAGKSSKPVIDEISQGSSEDDEALSGDDEPSDLKGFTDFGRRRFEGEQHCWDVADATAMMVRGANYLVDKIKVHSRAAMMDLVNAHLLKTENELVHYSMNPRGRILQLRREGDMRFFFTLNFRLLPIQFAVTWAIPKNADWFNKPEGRLFQKFREMSDEDRKSRLKILLKVVEGPWIVKSGVPDRPGVVGRKIDIKYFQAHDHLEASINCISSSAGRRLVSLLTGAAKHFAMEIFVIVEGQSEEELPERILGTLSIHHGDLSKVAYV